MALLITEQDLKLLLEDPRSMGRALDAIEQVFCEHRRGESRPLPWVHLPLRGDRGLLRVQLGMSPANGVAVRMYPLFAGARDLPDRHLILLLDAETGQLHALMAGDGLSPYRTGAPAGVACRYLAPPEARVLALLGSGRQARGQALAIRAALPTLELLRVYSPTPEHREAFAREMSRRLDMAVQPVAGARECVVGADVVDVATNARSPVLEAEWVRSGALVISIASHQLPPELVARARVVVSSREALLEGDRPREPYASMIAAGTWTPDAIAAELGQVLLGQAAARARENEVVLFEMPGMSVWDAAIANWAYRWAVEQRAGTTFRLSASAG